MPKRKNQSPILFRVKASKDAHLSLVDGQVFALFIIALVAAEAAVGLGIIIAIFRLRKVDSTDEIVDMRG